jgi:hypothetical protein
MVELEHERIGFAAVNTGPLTKELDEIGGRSAMSTRFRRAAFAT